MRAAFDGADGVDVRNLLEDAVRAQGHADLAPPGQADKEAGDDNDGSKQNE